MRLNKLHKKLLDLFRNDCGATAIEYGLIVTLIIVVAIGALEALGISTRELFSDISVTISGETEDDGGEDTGGEDPEPEGCPEGSVALPGGGCRPIPTPF